MEKYQQYLLILKCNVFNGNQGKIAVENFKIFVFQIKIDKKEIFLASTGVIGEPLDYKK